MSRASKKKKEFKKSATEYIKDNSFYLIVTLAFGAIIFSFQMYAITQRSENLEWNINTVIEDSIGEYTASLESMTDNPYIVVKGDLDELDVAELQHGVAAKLDIFIPLYYVEDNVELTGRVDYYTDGLIMRSDWTEDNHHNVTQFDEMIGINPDATAVKDWAVSEENSLVDGDTLVVGGYIDDSELDSDIYAQLRGLSGMVNELNVGNVNASYKHMLLNFDTSFGQVKYHTAHPTLLGKTSLFGTGFTESYYSNDVEESVAIDN